MSNTFWAVFFGAATGLFSVNVITMAIDEWRAKRRKKDIQVLLDHLEDIEFEEYEED